MEQIIILGEDYCVYRWSQVRAHSDPLKCWTYYHTKPGAVDWLSRTYRRLILSKVRSVCICSERLLSHYHHRYRSFNTMNSTTEENRCHFPPCPQWYSCCYTYSSCSYEVTVIWWFSSLKTKLFYSDLWSVWILHQQLGIVACTGKTQLW